MGELKLNKSYNFATYSCYTCGCVVALQDQFVKNRREDKNEWYCPNGHSQYFPGETDKERFKKELDREKKEY